MGEVLYRRDRYAQAAPFFEAAGRKPKAEKLKAFEGKTPFEIESGPDVSILPFLQTDPLPIIQLTINGREGKFLIDTGAWELHVLPAFAEKCGLKPLGLRETGTYAGGRQAGSSSAVADRVTLGDFSLRNVPIVLPERANSPFEVDGIVGTVVLYHFLFTLDYPRRAADPPPPDAGSIKSFRNGIRLGRRPPDAVLVGWRPFHLRLGNGQRSRTLSISRRYGLGRWRLQLFRVRDQRSENRAPQGRRPGHGRRGPDHHLSLHRRPDPGPGPKEGNSRFFWNSSFRFRRSERFSLGRIDFPRIFPALRRHLRFFDDDDVFTNPQAEFSALSEADNERVEYPHQAGR